MKYLIASAIIAAAGAAHAGDDDNGSFSGVTGAFGGHVSTMAVTGGVSASGSFGGYDNTRIRNESGAGQFAGAQMGWSADTSGASLTGESFVDGFDYSRTNAGGGYGGSMAARFGIAAAEGGFAGSFGSFEMNDDWDDFPGLGLGHGGFDNKPGRDRDDD